MKKIINLLSQNKFWAHIIALVLMITAPIILFISAPSDNNILFYFGMGFIITANLIALATK